MEIEKEKLEKLIRCFYDVCSMCNELDVYEHEEMDEDLQEMKSKLKKR